ncbi:hypothetical protein CONPUDRAFT_78473 [Coniophora puteana RWD-64-598 SS2]|uniref:Uncharacterized protein n=1 Tax=Coniophora puteana (strain RWD-64-598) TaxID=741705 RepID=R7SCF0_CONPW|nr:uncharacterized protein CONPUDRAFT_78473 [Coniophora puteana RWD-64-598 SS2]EIW73833.1 hypothetical protein CONPUDRAFT_78473 [Coniophora puteana RWD-64-598 SS2]
MAPSAPSPASRTCYSPSLGLQLTRRANCSIQPCCIARLLLPIGLSLLFVILPPPPIDPTTLPVDLLILLLTVSPPNNVPAVALARPRRLRLRLPAPRVYCHERSLKGVVRMILSAEEATPQENRPPPGLLGIEAERYLEAHAYLPAAHWSIWYAFHKAFGPEDFIAYLNDCLPSYLKLKKRQPTQRRFTKPHIPKTPAQRQSTQQTQRARKASYNEALEKSQEVLVSKALKLHGAFGGKSVEHHLEAIVQTSCIKGSRRSIDPWNAYLSKRLRAVNDNLAPDAQHLTAAQFGTQLKEEWNNLTLEERAAITLESSKDLEDVRANKNSVAHNFLRTAWHDATTTLGNVSNILHDLASRTAVKVLLVAVRADVDHIMRPWIYSSDAKVEEDFHSITKHTIERFSMSLEACSVAGLSSLVNNYRAHIAGIKHSIVSIINKNLSSHTTHAVFQKTPYATFDTAVTEKYGVVYDGGNAPIKFCNLSSIGSIFNLCLMLAAWQNKTVKFRKFTKEEWEAWEEAQFQAAMDRMSSDTSDVPQHVDTSSMVHAQPASQLLSPATQLESFNVQPPPAEFAPVSFDFQPASTSLQPPSAAFNGVQPTPADYQLTLGGYPVGPNYPPDLGYQTPSANHKLTAFGTESYMPPPLAPAAMTFEFVNSFVGPSGHDFVPVNGNRRKRAKK